METVHILFQTQFAKGNFGDIEQRPHKLLGVFGTKKEALTKGLKFPEKKFKVQFGAGIIKTFIVTKRVK